MRAPAGTLIRAAAPTAVIRPFSTMSVWSSIAGAPGPSRIRACERASVGAVVATKRAAPGPPHAVPAIAKVAIAARDRVITRATTARPGLRSTARDGSVLQEISRRLAIVRLRFEQQSIRYVRWVKRHDPLSLL